MVLVTQEVAARESQLQASLVSDSAVKTTAAVTKGREGDLLMSTGI